MHRIELPDGVEAHLSGSALTIRGSLGSNLRRFNASLLGVAVEGRAIIIRCASAHKVARKASAAEAALASELSNDVKGVCGYFEKRMEIVYAHFPMSVDVNGSTLVIKNMLGERAPRHAAIVGNTKLEIKGQRLRIYGTSLDDVAQSAANIRQACRIKDKDPRVFQDGIYLEVE